MTLLTKPHSGYMNIQTALFTATHPQCLSTLLYLAMKVSPNEEGKKKSLRKICSCEAHLNHLEPGVCEGKKKKGGVVGVTPQKRHLFYLTYCPKDEVKHIQAAFFRHMYGEQFFCL